MRHGIKLFAAFLLAGSLPAPADSRVFTTPGWYLVYYDDYEMEEYTGEGPYNSKEQCDATSYAIAVADGLDEYFDDYACIYLNAAMANDV